MATKRASRTTQSLLVNYSNSTDSAQSDDEVVSNVDPMVAIDDPDVKVRVQIVRQ